MRYAQSGARPARRARDQAAIRASERFEGKGRDTTTAPSRQSIATRATATRAVVVATRASARFRRAKGGRDKRDSGPSHRQWATSAAPRERDRPVDPNSPFAKLAALKEQLAGRKD